MNEARLTRAVQAAVLLHRVTRHWRTILIGGQVVIALVPLVRVAARPRAVPATPTTPTLPATSAKTTTNWRVRVAQVAALLAIYVLIVDTFVLWREDFWENLPPVALALLAAGVLYGLALRLVQEPTRTKTIAAVAVPAEGKILWDVVALGAWCLLVLALVSAGLFRMWLHAQMALLIVGIGLVWWGFCGRTTLDNYRTRQLSGMRRTVLRWPLVMLAGIMLLAFVLRVWKLDSAVHDFADEMAFTNAVVHLWDQPFDEVLHPFDPVASFTSVYPYLQYWTEKVTGPGLTALRLPSAILGTLTIPALYLLAVTLFDRKTALLAAFALAVFPPHIHTSRSGLNNVADPLFGTLALGLLAHGLTSHRRVDFVLAAIALGMTQYFYEGGRVLFLLVTVAWLGVMAAPHQLSTVWSPDTRILRRNLFIFGLVVFLVAAPVYVALRSNGFSFTPRYDWHGNGDTAWAAIREHGLEHFFRVYMRPPLLHFIRTPDGSTFFYGGTTPLVLAFLLPVFMLGVYFIVWRGLRDRGALLLALWCGATVFGNSLLTTPDWTPRFVVVFPPIALVMALGTWKTAALIWPRRWSLRTQTIIVIVLAIVAGVLQVRYYFGPHLDAYQVNSRPQRDAQDIIFRSVNFPPGTHVHLFTDEPVWWADILGMIRFWRLDIVPHWWPLELIEPNWLQSQARDVDQAFFIVPGHSEAMTVLRRYFVLDPPQLSPYNVPLDLQYFLYYADADHQPQIDLTDLPVFIEEITAGGGGQAVGEPGFAIEMCVKIKAVAVWEPGIGVDELADYVQSTADLFIDNRDVMPEDYVTSTERASQYRLDPMSGQRLGPFRGMRFCMNIGDLAPGEHSARIVVYSPSGAVHAHRWTFTMPDNEADED